MANLLMPDKLIRFALNRKVLFFLICIIVIVIYFPSLFHIPRADQLWYLLDTVKANGPIALIKDFYSYNRVRLYAPGDSLVFRPLLFALLGIAKWAFGNDYIFPQAIGIILHLVLIWQLIKLLNLINPGRIVFVFAAVFATLSAILDLVVWTHLNLTIVFMICALTAAYHLLIYTQGQAPRRSGNLLIITACLLIACFTYELGIIYALLFFIYLCFTRDKKKAPRFNWFYLLILAPAGLYIATDVFDYLSRNEYLLKLNMRQVDMEILTRINFSNAGRILQLFLELSGKWLLAGIFPTIFRIAPGARFGIIQLLKLNEINNIKPDMLVNILVISGLLIYIINAISFKIIAQRKRAISLFVAMLGGYMGIIIVARALERGTENIFQMCAYYSYFFWVFVIIILYCMIDNDILKKRLSSWHKYPLIACCITFIWLNALAVYDTNLLFARSIKNKRTYLSRINNFVKAHRKEADFSFKIYPHPREDEPLLFKELDIWKPFYLSDVFFGNYIDESYPKYVLSTDNIPVSPGHTGEYYK